MFKAFFEKSDMERVVWMILNAYQSLYYDQKYNESQKRWHPSIIAESAVLGAHVYCKERGIPEMDFIPLLIEKMRDHIGEGGQVGLETVCFMAASLRGDFRKHMESIGKYYGESLKKLNMDTSAFKKYKIDDAEQFIIFMELAHSRCRGIGPG